MKITGIPGFVDLQPETDEEHRLLQGLLDTGNDAVLDWGPAQGEGFLISTQAPAIGEANGQSGAPAAEPPKPSSIPTEA